MTELRDIEDAMIEHPDPVVSVPELADELDVSTTHVRNQLLVLEREDVVARKDVGARATAWWHEDRVTPRRVPPEDDPDQRPLDDVAAPDGRERGETSGGPWETVELPDLPGQGEMLERRETAIRAILRAIYKEGSTDNVYEPTYEAHDVGYASAKSWRKNAAAPALRELRERGVVELADPNRGLWVWAGDDDE